MSRNLKFSEAILEATDQLMSSDSRVHVMGLGAGDPKAVFGTTEGLLAKYGSDRILEMPTSENGMTGVAIGAAICGMRPILIHQRVDFALLSLDQIINNAAKWDYMFASSMSVPLVIRMILGRGWGQGPQHSQAFYSLFGHIPGLQVVAPATAYDAKGLLIAASRGKHPVIYFEHRWLHHTYSNVPVEMYETPLGKARRVQEGRDVTVVAIGHQVVEAIRALRQIEGMGVSVELLDLCSIRPLDRESILESVGKTGRLLVLEEDWKTLGVASEILASVAEEAWGNLKAPPARLCLPDQYCGTSPALSKTYYPTHQHIAQAILRLMGKSLDPRLQLERMMQPSLVAHDVPDRNFTGPF